MRIVIKKDYAEELDSQNFIWAHKISDVYPWKSSLTLGLVLKVQAKNWHYDADIFYSPYRLEVYSEDWVKLEGTKVRFSEMNLDSTSKVYDCMRGDWEYIDPDTDDPDELKWLAYYEEHGDDDVIYIGIVKEDMHYAGDGEEYLRMTAENMIETIVSEANGEYQTIWASLYNEDGDLVDYECVGHVHTSNEVETIADMLHTLKKDFSLPDDVEVVYA